MNLFKQSFKELGQLRPIILGGLLLALGIILEKFSIPLWFTKLGFGFIVTAISGMLFGPVYAVVFCSIADIVKFFLSTSPMGSFSFAWTLSAALGGFIYGIFLYRKSFDMNNKKQLLIRIILAKVIVSLFVNLSYNTFLMSATGGKAFLVLLPPRAIKELILIPVQIIILFYVLPIINKLRTD